jgi:hypothetical protein
MKVVLTAQSGMIELMLTIARVSQAAAIEALDRTLQWGDMRASALPRTTARRMRDGVGSIVDPASLALVALRGVHQLSSLNYEFLERVLEAIDEEPRSEHVRAERPDANSRSGQQHDDGKVVSLRRHRVLGG